MLDYSEKTKDIVLGVFLVGSDKEFKYNNFKKVISSNKNFKKFEKKFEDMIRKHTENDKSSYETVTGYICDELVEKYKKANPEVFKRFVDIANEELRGDYIGAGIDLAEILAYTGISIRKDLREVFEDEKVYGVNLIIRVPKYVNMILNYNSKKMFNNNREHAMYSDVFFNAIYEILEYEAKHHSVNGYMFHCSEWTEI